MLNLSVALPLAICNLLILATDGEERTPFPFFVERAQCRPVGLVPGVSKE